MTPWIQGSTRYQSPRTPQLLSSCPGPCQHVLPCPVPCLERWQTLLKEKLLNETMCFNLYMYGDKELAFHNQNVFFSKTSLHFEIRSTKLFLLEKINSANGLSSSTGSFDTTYLKSEGVDVSASKILALLKLHGSRNL